MTNVRSNEDVLLYSTPRCIQCVATKKNMERLGVTFTEVDLTKDTEAHQFVTSLGYSSAPVVYLNEEEHWSGFRPDKILTITKGETND